MSNPNQRLNDPEQLPLIPRLLAQICSFGLDLLEAKHPASWHEGRESARGQAEETGNFSRDRLPAGPSRLMIKYREETEHRSPGKTDSIFNDYRLRLSAEQKNGMRESCAAYLGELQPSPEQWKAIFSTSQTTSIVGSAGTGKTTGLILRIVFMHVYLKIPLSQITMLTFNRESRMEVATRLRSLLSKWGIDKPLDEILDVVKTPRSALLQQVRSLPDLRTLVPFEVLSDGAAVPEDGRPYDEKLTAHQESEMARCFTTLYQANKRFAELVQKLFAESCLVDRLEVDAPEVIKRAPFAWKLSAVDPEICDAVEGLWKKAGAWPLPGITATRKQFQLRGKPFNSSGFIPQLGVHVVLGFDRSEDRHLARGPGLPQLYKEVAIKRTIIQAYHPTGIVHLDSYEQAKSLCDALKMLPKAPPRFDYRLKGSPRAVDILEAFNTSSALIDSLGLEIGTVAGKMNFLAGDTDSVFFEALGVYWQALERQLAALPAPVVPFGRLFDLFSASSQDTLKHVPMSVLSRSRHLLLDCAEDYPSNVSSWLRGLLIEIRRRDSVQDGRGNAATSIMVAGDHCQWVYGSFGTTPKLLSDFTDLFPAPEPVARINLMDCFRSTQAIVDAAQSLLINLGVVAGKGTRSMRRVSTSDVAVTLISNEPHRMQELCVQAYANGSSILILLTDDAATTWVEQAVGGLIREDQSAEQRRIRVRNFHKAKGLEADVVFLVGDPRAANTSWQRNQLFKLAGVAGGGDMYPGDTVLEHEALKLVHLGMTRARRLCYWMSDTGATGKKGASNLVELNADFFIDAR